MYDFQNIMVTDKIIFKNISNFINIYIYILTHFCVVDHESVVHFLLFVVLLMLFLFLKQLFFLSFHPIPSNKNYLLILINLSLNIL